jgi:hypothetical protein
VGLRLYTISVKISKNLNISEVLDKKRWQAICEGEIVFMND